MYVLGTCGLRFGEVAELRWRDIDLENLRRRITRSVTLVTGIFVVGSTKNGKARTVSLPAFVADLLHPGDRMRWHSPTGGRLHAGRQRSTPVVVASGHRGAAIPPDHDRRDREAGRGVRLQTARTAAHSGFPGDRSRREHQGTQNMLGHESAGLTLDRYGHLYGSDVEAVGVAINNLADAQVWAKCGHGPWAWSGATGDK